MNDDWTPTTDDIREGWWRPAYGRDYASFRRWFDTYTATAEARGAEQERAATLEFLRDDVRRCGVSSDPGVCFVRSAIVTRIITAIEAGEHREKENER